MRTVEGAARFILSVSEANEGGHMLGGLQPALSTGAMAYAVMIAGPAAAQTVRLDVPAEDAAKAIPEFARQADVQILVSADSPPTPSIPDGRIMPCQ